MADNSYSMFNAMVDIIASPGKALDEIKSHTSWLWWPLLISILLASGLMLYYYNWVDFPWLIEETIRQLPAEDRAEAADVIRSFMTVGTSSWTTVVEVLKGNDDGTFISNTESPTGADDNVDLQLRFRAAGKGNGGYCYGDDVIVSGTPIGAN